MSDYSMADIATLLGASNNGTVVKNSTSRKGNTELNMEDFLTLMVVQLQNQTIDDTMDTSEMMNQMVQMQMISAITNMTETNVMSYASSLVGKIVTIGIVNGDSLEEREVEVIGTGVMNGQQVIFGKDNKGNVETYGLNQIMAVGRLPEIKDPEETPGEGEDGDKTDPTNPTNPTNPTDPTDPPKNPGDTSEVPGDRPVGGTGEGEGTNNAGEGEEDVVDPAAGIQGEI